MPGRPEKQNTSQRQRPVSAMQNMGMDGWMPWRDAIRNGHSSAPSAYHAFIRLNALGRSSVLFPTRMVHLLAVQPLAIPAIRKPISRNAGFPVNAAIKYPRK